MKKKSERFSFKKLTHAHRRQDSKVVNEPALQERKTQVKAKSSDKNQFQSQISQKFKLSSKINQERVRIKTEMEESVYKPKYQLKKKEKVERFKTNINDISKKNDRTFTHRNYSQLESKNKNVRKLHLNEELLKVIKNGSLEKYDAPLSGKHAYQSVRRPHDSYRSTKKTALEDYVSSSLENLKPKKSQFRVPANSNPKNMGRSKERDKESTLKNRKLKNLLMYDDVTATEELKKKKEEKKSLFEESKEERTQPRDHIKDHKNNYRAIYQEKDDSLEKFQIKFEKPNKWDLSKEEIQMFGDRFPDGFQKLKLLGRGGFSLVWLAQHKKNGKKFAIKQIITESTHQTHIKEIWFGTYFFDFGGAPKEEFKDHPGITNLVRLYYYFINKKDTWIVYEKCGDSLGNALYDLKGERVGSEKIYRIHHKQLYQRIRKNQNQLRLIILQVAKALELLAENNIIHSDLKTENILVREKTNQELMDEQGDPSISIAETKLIDYGSSFVFNNLRQFSMATPEYMAPEILNFILYENELEYIHKLLEYVQKYNKPWVIDMWSLGCVVLEIVSGIPLWMSLKTRVKRPGESEQFIKYGLFAVKGRLFDKIIRKQIEVIQNLDHYLYEENYSGIVLDSDLRALLKRMLSLNPEKRISPTEVIDFLEESLTEGGSFVNEFADKETISRKDINSREKK